MLCKADMIEAVNLQLTWTKGKAAIPFLLGLSDRYFMYNFHLMSGLYF